MTDELETNVSLDIGVPLDAHSYIRVECPNCGLDFKVTMAEGTFQDIVSWGVGRVLRAAELTETEPQEPKTRVWCPFCCHRGSSQEFLHSEHAEYMKRLVFREYVEPMLRQMFQSAFGGLKSTGLVTVTHESGPRSVRPMLGPEPNDMVRIRCVSCHTCFKVSATWRGTVCCSGCGSELLAS